MATTKFKTGNTVKLIDTKGLRGYPFFNKIKKGGLYKVRRVKRTGGLLLQNIIIGFNIAGKEQGLLPHRFELVKTKNQK